MQFLINHFYLLLAISFGVASQLIIKWKMGQFSFNDYETMTDKFIFAFSMLFNPYIIISLVFTLLAGVTWMIAMTKFEISYAYPFTILGLIFVSIFSVLFFGETISATKIIGILFVMIGIFIISRGM
jgi:multidrug transporter EmrE-like cation transporter